MKLLKSFEKSIEDYNYDADEDYKVFHAEMEKLLECSENGEIEWQYRPMCLLKELFSNLIASGYSPKDCFEIILKVPLIDKEKCKQIINSESFLSEVKQFEFNDDMEIEEKIALFYAGSIALFNYFELVNQTDINDPKFLASLNLAISFLLVRHESYHTDVYELILFDVNMLRWVIIDNEISFPILQIIGKTNLNDIAWEEIEELTEDGTIDNYRIDYRRFYFLLKNKYHRADRNFFLRCIHGISYSDVSFAIESDKYENFYSLMQDADNADWVSAICNLVYKLKQNYSVQYDLKKMHPTRMWYFKVIANAFNMRQEYNLFLTIQNGNDPYELLLNYIDDSKVRKQIRRFFSVMFAVFKPAVVTKIEDIINKSQLKDYIWEVLAEKDDNKNELDEKDDEGQSSVKESSDSDDLDRQETLETGIFLATSPTLPNKYKEKFCEKFAACCEKKNNDINRVKYFFWGQSVEGNRPLVTKENPLCWKDTSIRFKAFVCYAYSGGTKDLPVGLKGVILEGVRDKKGNNMSLSTANYSRYESYVEDIKKDVEDED